ncbi:MAG: hypothetical protein V4623_07745 [Pseudomonadota bacterium]
MENSSIPVSSIFARSFEDFPGRRPLDVRRSSTDTVDAAHIAFPISDKQFADLQCALRDQENWLEAAMQLAGITALSADQAVTLLESFYRDAPIPSPDDQTRSSTDTPELRAQQAAADEASLSMQAVLLSIATKVAPSKDAPPGLAYPWFTAHLQACAEKHGHTALLQQLGIHSWLSGAKNNGRSASDLSAEEGILLAAYDAQTNPIPVATAIDLLTRSYALSLSSGRAETIAIAEQAFRVAVVARLPAQAFDSDFGQRSKNQLPSFLTPALLACAKAAGDYELLVRCHYHAPSDSFHAGTQGTLCFGAKATMAAKELDDFLTEHPVVNHLDFSQSPYSGSALAALLDGLCVDNQDRIEALELGTLPDNPASCLPTSCLSQLCLNNTQASFEEGKTFLQNLPPNEITALRLPAHWYPKGDKTLALGLDLTSLPSLKAIRIYRSEDLEPSSTDLRLSDLSLNMDVRYGSFR